MLIVIHILSPFTELLKTHVYEICGLQCKAFEYNPMVFKKNFTKNFKLDFAQLLKLAVFWRLTALIDNSQSTEWPKVLMFIMEIQTCPISLPKSSQSVLLISLRGKNTVSLFNRHTSYMEVKWQILLVGHKSVLQNLSVYTISVCGE